MEGQAADVMLRRPKTLPADAAVAEVRQQLEHPSVQLVLLTDGPRFRGAVADIPADAPPEAPAIGFAEERPETIGPDAPADDAFELAARNPLRRVVVLGDDDELLGLVCLDVSRTRFCGIDAQEPPAS